MVNKLFISVSNQLTYFGIITFLSILITFPVSAQNADLESARIFAEKFDEYNTKKSYLLAAKSFEKSEDWDGFFTCYKELAKFYSGRRMQQPNEALEYLDFAINFAEGKSLSYFIELANCYHERGKLLYNRQFEKALSDNQNALRIKNELLDANDESLRKTLNNLAIVYYKKFGNYKKSIEYNAIALKIRLHNTGEVDEKVANYYNIIGACQYEMALFDEALKNFKKSLQIYQELISQNDSNRSKERLAGTTNNIGLYFMEKGNFKLAEEYVIKALSIWKEIKNSLNVGLAYYNLGDIYKKKSDYDRALTYYQKSLELRQGSSGREQIDKANSLERIADIYRRKTTKGEKIPPIAFQYMEQAIEIKNKWYGENHPEVIGGHHNLALFYRANKNYAKAIKLVKKSLSFTDESTHDGKYSTAHFLTELGIINKEAKKNQKSIHYFEAALTIRKSILDDDFPKLGESYFELAEAYFLNGELDVSLSNTDKALKILIPNLNKNKLFIDETKSPIFAFDALTLKASILYQMSTQSDNTVLLEEALFFSQLAADLISQLRLSYKSKEMKLALLEKSKLMYESAIETAFLLSEKKGGNYNEMAFRFSAQRKSAVLFEVLLDSKAEKMGIIDSDLLTQKKVLEGEMAFIESKLFEEQIKQNLDSEKITTLDAKLNILLNKHYTLTDAIEASSAAYRDLKFNSKPPSLQKLQKSLSDATLIIEYFLGNSALYTFSISKNGIALKKQPIDNNFFNLIRTFSTSFWYYNPKEKKGAVKLKKEKDDFVHDARQLYNILIADLIGEAETQLIIIPDGELNYLPFHILLESDVKEDMTYRNLPYLFRKKTIRYEYSISLLLHDYTPKKAIHTYIGFAPEYDGKKIASKGISDNFKFDEIYQRKLKFAFGSLEHNQSGVQNRAAKMGGISFVGRKGLENIFKNEAPKAKILEFSGHAWINDKNPLYSLLAFTQTADATEDDFLFIYELYNMQLNAELGILNGCNTGIGKLQKGEGVMSLSRAFKYAGCPNIVMSLWEAQDDSSEKIMSSFMENLKTGMNKDEALQKAQKDYVNDKVDLGHPYYWASFMLIGDNAPINFGSKKWIPWAAFSIVLLMFYLYRRRAHA